MMKQTKKIVKNRTCFSIRRKTQSLTVLKLNWKWKFNEAANTLIIYSNETPNMKFVINDDKTINFKSSLSPSDRNLRLIKLIKVKD